MNSPSFIFNWMPESLGGGHGCSALCFLLPLSFPSAGFPLRGSVQPKIRSGRAPSFLLTLVITPATLSPPQAALPGACLAERGSSGSPPVGAALADWAGWG